MVENPKIWFEKCSEYAVPNENIIVYGDLFLLKDNAPDEIKGLYKQYIDLLKKVYINSNFLIIVNKEIVNIQDNLPPRDYEQAKLTIHLIEKGLLKSPIFNLNNQAP